MGKRRGHGKKPGKRRSRGEGRGPWPWRTDPTPPKTGGMEPFTLAPPETVDPHIILRDRKSDKWGQFFLALALAYNDFKGLATWAVWTEAAPRPPDQPLTAELGEFRGLIAQLNRYTAGMLHELMRLIEAHAALVRDQRLVTLTGHLRDEFRETWDTLVAVALGNDDSKGATAQALLQIRNSVAFHYYGPQALADGYIAHFMREDPPSEAYDRAWFSRGTMMQTTRFHYADGAAEQAVAKQANEAHLNAWDERVRVLAGTVNTALRMVLHAFIDARKGTNGKWPDEAWDPSEPAASADGSNRGDPEGSD